MKTKKLIPTLLMLLLGTVYMLTVSSCSEIDEPEYIDNPQKLHLNPSEGRIISLDSINSIDSTLQSCDSIFIPLDSIATQKNNTVVGVQIEYDPLTNNKYSCNVHYKTLNLRYISYNSLLLPPDLEFDENGNEIVSILCTRSGFGDIVSTTTHYEVVSRNNQHCEIKVIANICVSILGYKRWESHGARIKFDGSHTAQVVNYGVSDLNSAPVPEKEIK